MVEAVGKRAREGLEPSRGRVVKSRLGVFRVMRLDRTLLDRSFLDRSRPLMTFAALLAVALLVGACGSRGPLRAPEDAKVDGAAKSSESADAGSNSAAPKKAHEPFILDGLLR